MRRVIFTDPDTGIPEIVPVVTWQELQQEAEEAGTEDD